MNKKDKQLCEALGLNPKLLSQEDKKQDILQFTHHVLYKHDKKPDVIFCSRELCLRDYAATRAKKMYGIVDKKWELLELYEYEKEKLRMIGMIQMQKKRYARGRYKV